MLIELAKLIFKKKINDEKAILICNPVQTLGDTVISSAFTNTIIDQFKDFKVDLIASKVMIDYYKYNSELNKIYYGPAWIRNWKVLFLRVPYSIYFYLKFLKNKNYKYIFLPRVDSDPLSIFISYMANHEKIIRFTSKSGCNDKVVLEKYFDKLSKINIKNNNRSMHERIVQNKLINEIIDVTEISKPRHWATSQNQDFNVNQKNIVFAIGSSAKFRRMSDLRILKIIKYIYETFDFEIKVIGGVNDSNLLKKINEIFYYKVKTNYNKYSLQDYLCESNKSSIIIGYDSGITHLLALNANAVIVISPHPINGLTDHPNSPTRFSPINDKCFVIQNKNKCLKDCNDFCRAKDSECMDRISISEILNTLNMII